MQVKAAAGAVQRRAIAAMEAAGGSRGGDREDDKRQGQGVSGQMKAAGDGTLDSVAEMSSGVDPAAVRCAARLRIRRPQLLMYGPKKCLQSGPQFADQIVYGGRGERN